MNTNNKKQLFGFRKLYWILRNNNVRFIFTIRGILFNSVVRRLSTYKSVNIEDTGMCTLLCHKDVNRFVYSLSSFYYFSGLVMPIYIVDDGSLTSDDYLIIQRHFPATIENETQSGRRLKTIVKNYKYIKEFRFDPLSHALRKKIDAILLCPFIKFIYIDADVLFFKKPTEIIEWINHKTHTNLYTAHMSFPNDMFRLEKEIIINSFRKLISDKLLPKTDTTFNSGLLCIFDKNTISLKRLDHILSVFNEISFTYHLLVEELSFAYALKSNNLKLLPLNKYINVWNIKEYESNVSPRTVSIHYTSHTKDEQFASDAIKLARSHNYFW